MMPPSAIAGYEDWPAFCERPRHRGTGERADRLVAVLGVPAQAGTPEVSVVSEHVVDGVRLRELGWQLPFGPRTTAWSLEPEQHDGALPGVLWLHCHGGNKFLGAERLVDRGAGTDPSVRRFQAELYEGRAVANELARAGFAVLVHDPFAWGSRRFHLDPPPTRTAELLAVQQAAWAAAGTVPDAAAVYNAAAAYHENTIAKTAGMLGTSFAGMVAHDDLAALAVLKGLPGVDAHRIGTGGFSGGGGRALVLAALAPEVRACVVACMMTTFASLVPYHLEHHSWLLNTPGLARASEWPGVAAVSEHARFLVQFAAEDALFPVDGMQEADEELRRLFEHDDGRYRAAWHPGGHVFTAAFLEEVADFLTEVLGE
ncbi:acetyl esterase [Arthrobacter sp. RIT-PI-e]|uniref:dienelactone hydrolase family protein n=1 Tax=Arthrobacter sp. RIT-PI-e TaxID=1681197 RepID=UPI0006767491|nr:acetylxylan esterase [Arthrobacter sp. RIT-PI-e]KNC20122.1 acetyl esterase [Arthrobacter sp. RIT-PI-e]